jgi:tetratricopeptide (TPR) repeat protein
VWWLKAGIVIVGSAVLMVAVYAVIMGTNGRPEPKTYLEAKVVLLKSYVETEPTSGKAWRDYASALHAAGDRRAAWAAVAKAKKSVRGLSRRYPLVSELDLLFAEGKYEKVVAQSRKHLDTERAYKRDHIRLRAKEGIKVRMRDISPNVTVDMLVYQARASGALGNWAAAAKALSKALYWDPKAADILVLRGQAYERLRRFSRAQKDYEKALRYIPGMEAAREGLERLEQR